MSKAIKVVKATIDNAAQSMPVDNATMLNAPVVDNTTAQPVQLVTTNDIINFIVNKTGLARHIVDKNKGCVLSTNKDAFGRQGFTGCDCKLITGYVPSQVGVKPDGVDFTPGNGIVAIIATKDGLDKAKAFYGVMDKPHATYWSKHYIFNAPAQVVLDKLTA